MRLFFATDLHGSEPCFRKFVHAANYYNVRVLVLGGDLAGKAILPIVAQGGGIYRASFLGRNFVLADSKAIEKFEKDAKAVGYYPRKVSPEQAEVLANDPHALATEFNAAVAEFFENWLTFAEERLPPDVECYVMGGNDDFPAVLTALSGGKRVRYVEGIKVLIAGEFEMISVGYSNRTPWNSPREVDDDELGEMVRKLAEQINDQHNAIFNVHCPPYGTALDLAPEIDDQLRIKMQLGQPNMSHVGSEAVRRVIDDYQPMLGLHGHCHESRGIVRLGRTVCLNPGSEYANGVLRGAIISMSRGNRTIQHQFVAA
jgi:uncharacterized protein